MADLLVGYLLGVGRRPYLAGMCQVESGEPQPVAVLRLEVVGG
ncbi:hypothetical protein [Streptomyces scabichelini]|nr:hypothetical protein [Streptomyces scabichelini]